MFIPCFLPQNNPLLSNIINHVVKFNFIFYIAIIKNLIYNDFYIKWTINQHHFKKKKGKLITFFFIFRLFLLLQTSFYAFNTSPYYGMFIQRHLFRSKMTYQKGYFYPKAKHILEGLQHVNHSAQISV